MNHAVRTRQGLSRGRCPQRTRLACCGAALLALISTALQPFPALRMIIYALALVVIMLFRPQGLMGSREVSLGVLRRFRRPEVVPAAASAAPAVKRDDDEEAV